MLHLPGPRTQLFLGVISHRCKLQFNGLMAKPMAALFIPLL